MANNHHHHQHTIDANDPSSLLELAANDDSEAFRRSLELRSALVDEVGEWYERKRGSNSMALERRTPLMVAATYGSLDVLRLILSFSSVDVNRPSVHDSTTALHCAASGGSANAVEAVKMLLSAGADPNMSDANGHRPVDVIVASPKPSGMRSALEDLLGKSSGDGEDAFLRVLTGWPSSNSPLPSSSFADSMSSPLLNKLTESQPEVTTPTKRSGYPVDPSIPDIKDSIYATDDFRMYSFKVRPCSRAYSHGWTECPFVHPGENARRRDPRKFHYSCVPCPDFRKGSCRRGDMCEYAHGVFECWLHPAQYRTRLCKDGTNCSRRVCFFAHTQYELRPLYVSTGSAVRAMEMAAPTGRLMPWSPSSVPAPFTPPISPLANGVDHYPTPWLPQLNTPSLLLSGVNSRPQASRLPASFNARENMPMDDLSMMQDFSSQRRLLNDLCYSRLNASAGNRFMRSETVTPSNLDNLFSAEINSSSQYSCDQGVVLHHHQQQQQSRLLSSVNTTMLSPKALDARQLAGHSSLLQASFGFSSPSVRMSPHSPLRSSSLAVLSEREKQQQTLRNLSSRDDLGSGVSQMVGSPVSSWFKCADGNLNCGINVEELGHLRQSSSFEQRANCEEPDLSWVHSLVKDSPEKKGVTAGWASSGLGRAAGEVTVSNGHDMDQAAALGAWLEQMQLDHSSTLHPNIQ